MSIHVAVSRTKHKTSSKLKRVLASSVLPVSCGTSARPRFGVVASKQMQKAAGLKLCRPVSNSLLIHQQRKSNPTLFPEELCVSRIAQPYRRKLSPRIGEITLMLAQLRDVLTAENSPIMTKKNEHRRTPLPKRAEPYLASVRIR